MVIFNLLSYWTPYIVVLLDLKAPGVIYIYIIFLKIPLVKKGRSEPYKTSNKNIKFFFVGYRVWFPLILSLWGNQVCVNSWGLLGCMAITKLMGVLSKNSAPSKFHNPFMFICSSQNVSTLKVSLIFSFNVYL